MADYDAIKDLKSIKYKTQVQIHKKLWRVNYLESDTLSIALQKFSEVRQWLTYKCSSIQMYFYIININSWSSFILCFLSFKKLPKFRLKNHRLWRQYLWKVTEMQIPNFCHCTSHRFIGTGLSRERKVPHIFRRDLLPTYWGPCYQVQMQQNISELLWVLQIRERVSMYVCRRGGPEIRPLHRDLQWESQ
jgi:hypothetical protein